MMQDSQRGSAVRRGTARVQKKLLYDTEIQRQDTTHTLCSTQEGRTARGAERWRAVARGAEGWPEDESSAGASVE